MVSRINHKLEQKWVKSIQELRLGVISTHVSQNLTIIQSILLSMRSINYSSDHNHHQEVPMRSIHEPFHYHTAINLLILISLCKKKARKLEINWNLNKNLSISLTHRSFIFTSRSHNSYKLMLTLISQKKI